MIKIYHIGFICNYLFCTILYIIYSNNYSELEIVMSDTDKLETLNTESKIIYNYFVTNEYANKALNLLLDYLNAEYDFDDAIKQLAKEISEVVDGFTYEIVNEFDPLVSALMTASINKIDYLTIAEILIEDYLAQV